MTAPCTPRFILAVALATSGCKPTTVVPCTECTLTDANNFTWSGDLEVEQWQLKAGADVRLSWSRLTHDLYGGGIDPAVDIARVALLAMPQLSPDEVTEAFAHDQLLASDAALIVFCEPSEAACQLTDFELFGNGLDVETYFVEETGTWVAALLTDDDTIASVALLLPDADSTAVDVAFTDDTSTLTVEVDLGSLTPVVVPAGQPFSLDWSALTVDGLGNDLSVDTLARLVVGRFDLSASDLETRVYDLEATADPLWTLDVSEPFADLSALEGASPFAGIDADGTWVLALYCGSCLNPAPRFVTLLEPA